MHARQRARKREKANEDRVLTPGRVLMGKTPRDGEPWLMKVETLDMTEREEKGMDKREVTGMMKSPDLCMPHA